MTIPAAALRQAMRAKGWNVTALAYNMGVTEGAVRRWLNGQAAPAGNTLLLLMASLPGFRDAIYEEIAS